MERIDIENNIKKEAAIVLLRVILFIVYYITLIALGIGLFFGAFWVTILLLQLMAYVNRISLRVAAIILLLWLAMWWFCIQFAWYLVKPLFTFHSYADRGRFEIKTEDCPEMFAMIADVAEATGNKMPKHVYLTADANACVFYNSTSIWTIFFPARKNLIVGLGLMQGMNKDELKAILGHEFGHFSQQTMKVGTISYRLLLIIQDMVKQALKQQQSAAISRVKGEGNYFHLANIPISFVTKITINFYKYIEKRNRSLSRFMEFEADSVACSIAGAKSFISSLCKLSVISERNKTYENIVADLIYKRQYINDYWSGYEVVCSLLSDETHVQFTYADMLESIANNETQFTSKVNSMDEWSTHPLTKDRIERALQYLEPGRANDIADARTVVPKKVMDAVGKIKLKLIAENMQMPVEWTSTDEISLNDFRARVEQLFREHPLFLQPFFDKMIISITLPEESEMLDPVDNPFNEANRNLLLELRQGIEDMQKLNQIKSEESADKHLLYNGEDTVCTVAIVQQLQYLSILHEKVKDLDIQMYKYLWKKAEDKVAVENAYRALFLGDSGRCGMRNIVETITAIREQMSFLRTHGQGVRLKDEIIVELTNDFCNFMHSFDYRLAYKLSSRDDADCQRMDEWLASALNGNSHNVFSTDLFKVTDEMWSMVNDLYNSGKSQVDKRMVDAYYSGISQVSE